MDATWCDAKHCRVQPPKEQDLKTHDLQRSSTLGLGLPNNGYQHCCFPHSQILQTHPILADWWWYYLVEDYSPTQFQHIKHQTSPWPRDLGRFLWMFHDFWILLLDMNMSWLSLGLSDPSQSGAAQLFPAPVWPKTKLSGRKSWPKGPARTLSMVPGAHWKPMGCW